MKREVQKPVYWIGTSYADWRKLPADVQDVMGYALGQAQFGKKAGNVKPLKGLKGIKGASVLEIIDDFDGDTFRAIYTVQFKKAVYVLHVFQKRSKKGISTPKAHIRLIEQRLKDAGEHYEANQT